mmetsp:Transcript_18600/g.30217  ORF Transcript_18600/g.30217 Transcript_18600/m.30217 type:complete len:201 (-) Transcript_18600:135-737(-)
MPLNCSSQSVNPLSIFFFLAEAFGFCLWTEAGSGAAVSGSGTDAVAESSPDASCPGTGEGGGVTGTTTGIVGLGVGARVGGRVGRGVGGGVGTAGSTEFDLSFVFPPPAVTAAAVVIDEEERGAGDESRPVNVAFVAAEMSPDACRGRPTARRSKKPVPNRAAMAYPLPMLRSLDGMHRIEAPNKGSSSMRVVLAGGKDP